MAISPSPARRHQEVARRLVVQLDRELSTDPCSECHLYDEPDWHVDEFTVVRPDILIVCSDSDGNFITTLPAFVAEILSPSTADKDQTAKRALYESQGVNFHLIVDPDNKRCELLTLGADGNYAASAPTAPITLHPDCTVVIDSLVGASRVPRGIMDCEPSRPGNWGDTLHPSPYGLGLEWREGG